MAWTMTIAAKASHAGIHVDFEEFFEIHSREVAAYVALTTGSVVLAEEATQEAFTRAYERWRSVSKMARPDSWVLRVATRAAIDAWRRRQREVSELDHQDANTAPDEVRRLWLEWGLAQLTPVERAMVILRYRDGLPVTEVAAELQYSPHTVTRYLKKALRKLRTIFDEEKS
jgi:RNA polymerase sigma-70 factor (ECF subfamily)